MRHAKLKPVTGLLISDKITTLRYLAERWLSVFPSSPFTYLDPPRENERVTLPESRLSLTATHARYINVTEIVDTLRKRTRE